MYVRYSILSDYPDSAEVSVWNNSGDPEWAEIDHSDDGDLLYLPVPSDEQRMADAFTSLGVRPAGVWNADAAIDGRWSMPVTPLDDWNA